MTAPKGEQQKLMISIDLLTAYAILKKRIDTGPLTIRSFSGSNFSNTSK